jgi:hypothetical protein
MQPLVSDPGSPQFSNERYGVGVEKVHQRSVFLASISVAEFLLVLLGWLPDSETAPVA